LDVVVCHFDECFESLSGFLQTVFNLEMPGFEDLIVWHKAMALVESVYRVSSQFPKEEIYSLTVQIRRCAVSVPSNIAEGEGRRSQNEFGRFLQIANGSLMELRTQLLIAERLKFVGHEEIEEPLAQTNEVGRMLHGLIVRCKSTQS
jgi:four helix bundle protein